MKCASPRRTNTAGNEPASPSNPGASGRFRRTRDAKLLYGRSRRQASFEELV